MKSLKVKIEKNSIVTFLNKYGPWALVVGAAEGLGEAYTKVLAAHKMNIILVDHQADKMQALAAVMEKEHGIECRQIHLDLKDKQAHIKIMEVIESLDVGLLIYNAAKSLIKPFVKYNTEELNDFVEINTRQQILLVHAFSQKLVKQERGGGILLMSSLAGLIGMQLVSPYAATKAFAWNLAEGLYHDLKSHQIEVMACIAGTIDTPTYNNTKAQYGLLKPSVMKPEEVAEQSLHRLGKQALFIPGFSNRLNYFILARLLPRKWAAAIANKTMGKMYAHWK